MAERENERVVSFRYIQIRAGLEVDSDERRVPRGQALAAAGGDLGTAQQRDRLH